MNLPCVARWIDSTSPLPRPAPSLPPVRHGESEWNDLNIFTGWADAALNDKGREEAAEGGRYLREAGFTFDVAYTSVLKRAIKTLWIVLEELDLMYIPIVSRHVSCGRAWVEEADMDSCHIKPRAVFRVHFARTSGSSSEDWGGVYFVASVG